MADVRFQHDCGGLVGVTVVSEAGREWFNENVESISLECIGSTLWVEARMANDLMLGMEDAGLELEVA